MEDTENMLALDGAARFNQPLKLRRGKDYNARDDFLVVARHHAYPNHPPSFLFHEVITSRVLDTPHTLFFGGFPPHHVTPAHAREMITAFGRLESFHADTNPTDDTIRNGVWFTYCRLHRAETEETFDADADAAARIAWAIKAAAGLNGVLVGGHRTVACLVTPHAAGAGAGAAGVSHARCVFTVPACLASLLAQPPSRVLEFIAIAARSMMTSMPPSTARDIEADVRAECCGFGAVLSTHCALVAHPTDADAEPAAEADAEPEAEEVNTGADDVCVGSVFVEFARTETATLAAHTLHGRVYDDDAPFGGSASASASVVRVRFVPLREYRARFKKGLAPSTHEEKQRAALEAQEHLSALIPETEHNPRLIKTTTTLGH